jgi:hypothetical protein
MKLTNPWIGSSCNQKLRTRISSGKNELVWVKFALFYAKMEVSFNHNDAITGALLNMFSMSIKRRYNAGDSTESLARIVFEPKEMHKYDMDTIIITIIFSFQCPIKKQQPIHFSKDILIMSGRVTFQLHNHV